MSSILAFATSNENHCSFRTPKLVLNYSATLKRETQRDIAILDTSKTPYREKNGTKQEKMPLLMQSSSPVASIEIH